MSDKDVKRPLLKPHFFGKDDPENPKNIDAEKKLEEARRKRKEELATKIIIINEEK